MFRYECQVSVGIASNLDEEFMGTAQDITHFVDRLSTSETRTRPALGTGLDTVKRRILGWCRITRTW